MHAVLYRNDPPPKVLRPTAKRDSRLGRSQYLVLPAFVRASPDGHHREWFECPVSPREPLGWELVSQISFYRCSFCAPRGRDNRNGHSHRATLPQGPVSRVRLCDRREY